MIDNAPSGRTVDGLELEARRSLVDIAECDRVHRAAYEVVAALIESRWSLSAAVVVVSLRRLCEAVAGAQADAWPSTLAFLDGLANGNTVKAATNGDDSPLASAIGAVHRPPRANSKPVRDRTRCAADGRIVAQASEPAKNAQRPRPS